MRVLSVGTFDPLHEGHRALIADMRSLAGIDGRVIVGVNSDDFYRRHRGAEPFQTLPERLTAVAANRDVDMTYVNDADDGQIALIDRWAPDVLLVGLDWAHDGYLTQIGAPSWEWFRERDIIVSFTPRHGSVSGTELRAAARG